jgi:hypothetical protein
VYLLSLLAHEPTEKNRWAEGIKAAKAAGAPIAGIWRLFAWKPPLAEHLSRLAHEVLRGPSELPPGFRELIAAFVSSRNHCLF